MLRSRIVALWLGTFLLAGCSDPKANVSGTVKYDGSPIANGQITFTPSDGSGTVVGSKIENGQYSIKGLKPGEHRVKVEAFKKVNFAGSSQEMMDKAADMKVKGNDTGLVDPADIIADDAEGNNQVIEFTAGEHKKDFEIRRAQPKR